MRPLPTCIAGHLVLLRSRLPPRAHLGVQGIQPVLPQGPVLAQPFIDLGERLGAKTVNPPLRLLADLDQPRLPQHPQMPRYPWVSNRQQRREITLVAGPPVRVSRIVRRLSSATARRTASMT